MLCQLATSHVVFANANVNKNVFRFVAAQKIGKHRAQFQTFGKSSQGPYMAAPKTIKPGLNGTEAKKSSSGINGTTIHRKQ